MIFFVFRQAVVNSGKGNIYKDSFTFCIVCDLVVADTSLLVSSPVNNLTSCVLYLFLYLLPNLRNYSPCYY